ncbi:hypothetical protein BH10CHL1_BH10CHL1_46990 [soil metagenome]
MQTAFFLTLSPIKNQLFPQPHKLIATAWQACYKAELEQARIIFPQGHHHWHVTSPAYG